MIQHNLQTVFTIKVKEWKKLGMASGKIIRQTEAKEIPRYFHIYDRSITI
jgi:hypothetical protein